MMRYMKVHDITDYIVGHCEEISSLDELARLFYIDKSYLSRIFKEVTNFTVNEFINCQRIGKARLLLAETEKTMEEVAKELGYDSLAYGILYYVWAEPFPPGSQYSAKMHRIY